MIIIADTPSGWEGDGGEEGSGGKWGGRGATRLSIVSCLIIERSPFWTHRIRLFLYKNITKVSSAPHRPLGGGWGGVGNDTHTHAPRRLFDPPPRGRAASSRAACTRPVSPAPCAREGREAECAAAHDWENRRVSSGRGLANRGRARVACLVSSLEPAKISMRCLHCASFLGKR